MPEAYQAQRDGFASLAAARFAQVINVQPWRSDLIEPLAQARQAAGGHEEAINTYRMAQDTRKLSAQGSLALGDLLLAAKRPAEAAQVWQSFVSNPPSDADSSSLSYAYAQLAALALKEDDLDAALTATQGRLQAVPTDAQAAYQLGILRMVFTPDLAIAPLLQASNGDLRYEQPVTVLIDALQQADTVTDPAYAWVIRGRALASQSEWLIARAAFENATLANPTYADAWAFLAESNFQTGRNGLSALDQANHLNPSTPIVRALTALNLRRSGKLEEAIEALQAVSRSEPQQPVWLTELGSIYAQKNDLITAQAYYEQAALVAPNDIQQWNNLANFCIQNSVDLRGVGLNAARRAVLLDPQNPIALDLMGQIFLNLGDLIGAERFFQRALESQSNFAPAVLHLGIVYLEQGASSNAYAHLRRAVQLNPQGPVGELARRLLNRYFGEQAVPQSVTN